jgi:hypothetical protein
MTWLQTELEADEARRALRSSSQAAKRNFLTGDEAAQEEERRNRAVTKPDFMCVGQPAVKKEAPPPAATAPQDSVPHRFCCPAVRGGTGGS